MPDCEADAAAWSFGAEGIAACAGAFVGDAAIIAVPKVLLFAESDEIYRTEIHLYSESSKMNDFFRLWENQ